MAGDRDRGGRRQQEKEGLRTFYVYPCHVFFYASYIPHLHATCHSHSLG